jgi:hypothetical protein
VSAVERQPSKREIVESELRRIWDERGELNAHLVLDEARPEDSVLHGAFDWDDGRAAEKFRLVQAAMLIRQVKVRITQVDAAGQVTDYSVRQWQPARYIDGEGETGNYLPVEQIREDPKQRQLLVNKMARDAEAFRRRYSHLREFTAVVRELLESDADESA